VNPSFFVFTLKHITADPDPQMMLLSSSMRMHQPHHDAEQPDRHPPGSAWSGSAANDRPSFAIQCLCSSDNPGNSIPRPSNVAALLRQEV